MGAVRGAVLQFERRGFIPCPLSFLLPLDGICHFLWEVLFHACSLRIPLLVVSSFAGFARLRGAYALSSFFQNIRPYLIGFDPHDTGLASCNLRSFSLLSRLVFSFHARNPRFFSRRIYACSSGRKFR